MPFTQQTLFGSSVRSFTCSLGWGSSPSQLNIALVDDPSNGDSFNPVSIGGSVYFTYDTFTFNGILQSYVTKKGSDGNPVYDCVIVDPRELLSGVQCIIGGYTGGVYSVPNLYNIYGAYEAGNYGAANVNEGGMEWWRIRDGFITLQSSTPIKFRGEAYTVDFTNLPALPVYYRIGGESVSLMDFISEVCEAASCDFFFRLETSNVITIYTISRLSQPALGYIQTFVDSTTGVTTNNAGRELRNETTSKFLVGGNRAEMFFQYPNSGTSVTDVNQTIWPFWGTSSGSVIIGQSCAVSGDTVTSVGNADNFNSYHRITLDSRGVNAIGVGDSYTTDVDEIRAALDSQESWEASLVFASGNSTRPQFGRAAAIGMMSDLRSDMDQFLVDLSESRFRGIVATELAGWNNTLINKAYNANADLTEESQSILYRAVQQLGSEYYGKKYMVRIPAVSGKYDADSNRVITTLEPTDGAYIAEASFSGAVAANLMPGHTNFVTLSDSRVQPYARFDNYTQYDLSDLSTEDYTVHGSSIFVKGTLDPDVYFSLPSSVESPRVVFNLPGMVKYKDWDQAKADSAVWKRRVYTVAKSRGASEMDARNIAASSLMRMGGESAMLGEEALAKMPDMVAVPLKSNIDFYGPWYSIGVSGKVEFEKDDTLVPWNYDGYATMNLAAWARVSESLTNLQVGEDGSIEVPGIPTLSVGDQLIASGPYVTDINVSIGSQGATTTYHMQTWTPRFGKLSKAYQDRIKSMAVAMQQDRRLFREATKLPPAGSKSYAFRKNIVAGAAASRARRKKPSSSSQVIAGEFINRGSSLRTHVVIAPVYNVASHLVGTSGIFGNKIVNSLDTLFRPFTTDTSASGVPHFEEASGTGGGINANTLNPYAVSDFTTVTRGDVLASGHLNDSVGPARGMGLRFPLVGVGWGYDTNGNRVPAGSDYATRPDLWKAGPVDIRWNDTSKMWEAGSSNLKHGRLSMNLLYRSSGLMNTYTVTSSGEHWDGTKIYIYDWLLPSGKIGYSGRNVIAGQIGSRWYAVAIEPAC